MKVLKAGVTEVIDRERFLAERATMTHLEHPHVLTLFTSGEADGLLYYVTPFVEGESLRERIERDAPLPVEEVLRLAGQIGRALTYVHGKGVVHRDIKPGNILLSSGEPIVADFGIARWDQRSPDERFTRTGMSVGTSRYMSPEQHDGKPGGPSSDQYALACVVFEMLVGHPPFQGTTGTDILVGKVTEPVPAVSTLRSDVPASVDAVLSRALERLPEDRFASVEAFLDGLSRAATSGAHSEVAGVAGDGTVSSFQRSFRWVWASALVGVVAVLVVLFSNGGGTPLLADQPLTVAIEPLQDLRPTRDAGFVDGIHADVIYRLQHIPGAIVIDRGSMLAATGEGSGTADYADALGADVVVTGSVSGSGATLAIKSATTGELIDSVTVRGSEEQFALFTGQLAGSVAEALPIDVDPVVRARVDGTPDVPNAVYVRVVQETSRDFFDPTELLAIDAALTDVVSSFPGFARAWGYLAAIRILRAHMTDSPHRMIPEARIAAEEALKIDPRDPTALGAIAHIAYDYDYDWERADSLFKAAVEVHPWDPFILQPYGALLTAVGDFERGREFMRRTVRAAPAGPGAGGSAAWPLLASGNTPRALQVLDSALSERPADALTKFFKYDALVAEARYTEAADLAAANRDLFSLARSGGAVALALSGREAEARVELERLEGLAADGYLSPVGLAEVYAALGEHERALDRLDDAWDGRDSFLAHVRERTALAVLVDEPRYQALLDSLAFPDR